MTPSERKALKAKAHKLEPVVQIGAKGLAQEIKVLDLRAHRRRVGPAGWQGVRALQEETR